MYSNGSAPADWDKIVYDIDFPNGWIRSADWGNGWLSINNEHSNTIDTNSNLGFRIYLPANR